MAVMALIRWSCAAVNRLSYNQILVSPRCFEASHVSVTRRLKSVCVYSRFALLNLLRVRSNVKQMAACPYISATVRV